MHYIDFLIIALVAGILALACRAIYRSKKSGKKCIGCPDSCACSNTACSGCSGQCNRH